MTSLPSSQPLWSDTTDSVPTVALASSFRALWPELMATYTEQTGARAPKISFASSGLLSTQIRHGAPFDVFLSADSATINLLQTAGKTKGDAALLAQGTLSLVAWSPTETHQTLSLDTLADKLAGAKFKLAMPNPRHAPYGVAAQQALQHAGLWPLPARTVLSAENAAQTLQFALTGAVDVAIVPTTLVIEPPPGLQVSLLSSKLYEPVQHQAVLLESADETSVALFEWLQSEPAKAVMKRFGLTQKN